MEKPKVIIFTTAYFPFIGGAEVAIQEITKRLKDRFDFYIITSRFSRSLPKKEVRPEGTIIRIGFGTRFDKWLLLYRGFASIVAIKALPLYATILLGVDISQGSLAAAIYKFFHPKTRFIFNIQYGYGEERLKKGRFGMLAIAFRFVLSRADYVTAISNHLLEVARQYGYRGPAEVIPNGVDLQKFRIKNLESRIKNKSPKIIITTSRLVPKNGIDILIKAVAEVKKEIPDIQCWIIGDGPEKISYQLLVNSYQLEKNVKLFGEVPHNEIPEYLHRADIFVRPSRSEGMGNSFVEAMASGLPVIGTPVGGINDIIIDKETGLFAKAEDSLDLAEKIKILLKDNQLKENLIQNGEKMVHDRFSWDKIAVQYDQLFQQKHKKSPAVKILIATGLFPPDIGGPATYSKILLDELPKRRFSVKMVSFGSVRSLPKILRHTVYFLKILQAAWKSDIIFAQDSVSVGFPAMMATKILRKRFLLKIVGDYAWEQHQTRNEEITSLEDFQRKKFDFITELRRFIEFMVARQAELIITPSKYLKKIISGWGVKEDKIIVVCNSFDIPRVIDSKEEARNKLNLSGFTIISAGRLVPWKGFEGIIDIMPEIYKEIPQVKFVIIGSGPDEKKLKDKIKELNLEGVVTLTGEVSHNKLLVYLRAGDLFLLNTSYEGFSHVLLEAMAMEIPVITTLIGGNPEIITDQISGLLVEHGQKEKLKEAVLRFYKDKELRLRLGKQAFLKVKEFNKDNMLDKLTSLFQNHA